MPLLLIDYVDFWKNWIDWEWEDLYHVGSCWCFVRWQFSKWSTRPRASCFWKTLFPHKWGTCRVLFYSWLNPLMVIWTLSWFSLLCFMHRSKLSILTSNSSISATALFSRLNWMTVDDFFLCPCPAWPCYLVLFDVWTCFADIQRANSRSIRSKSKKPTGKIYFISLDHA